MEDIREGRCPLCQHNEIIEAIPAEFGDQDMEKVKAVTYDARWVQGGRNPNHPHGPMRLFVCRKCGYAQWFVDQPWEIPIDQEHATRLIQGPETKLYR